MKINSGDVKQSSVEAYFVEMWSGEVGDGVLKHAQFFVVLLRYYKDDEGLGRLFYCL